MNTSPMKSRPTIDQILNDFFQAQLHRTRGENRQRIETVRRLLLQSLETDGERVLVDEDLALLEVERAFNPTNAFARTMHADDLLVFLPAFVTAPWLAEDLTLREKQIWICDALVKHLGASGLLGDDDYSCFFLEAQARVQGARAGYFIERKKLLGF